MSSFRFSAVLPTYNRAEALRANLRRFLDLDGLDELIVVDDCSSDGTHEFLAAEVDPRIKVIRHPENRGSPAARSTGIAVASSDWVLMLEDDCLVPAEYAAVLHEVAEKTSADLVGAPWVHAGSRDVLEVVDERRSKAVDFVGLWTHPSEFPSRNIETPFMPALILARRAVFQSVSFQRRYRGNAWREETDFFLSAIEDGYRCVLTPGTYSYQIGQWSGGQRRGVIRYELWCVINNWIFLNRHHSYLKTHGVIRSIWMEQSKFVYRRCRPLLGSLVRKIAARTRLS